MRSKMSRGVSAPMPKASILVVALLSLSLWPLADAAAQSSTSSGKEEGPRYGGPYAPWNIPATQLPTDPISPLLVDKLWDHTGGRFNLNSDKWTVAIYDAADATGEFPVVTKHPDWGNAHGIMVPWNPEWRIPDDSDAMVAVVDHRTGQTWEYWGNTRFDGNMLIAGSANLIQAGLKADWGEPANIFIKESGYQVTRASGFPSVYMMATRDEIERGHIPHALTLLWLHPAKGAYVGPATKGAGGTGGASDRLPMGTRFVWDFSDEDIDAWVETLDPAVRQGMRAIAVALRDYGAIGTDHGGGGEGENRRGAIWVEHDYSARWSEIGFKSEATLRALDSLLSNHKDKVRAVAQCEWPDGDMSKVCCYPADIVDYPEGHDCRP